MEFLKNFCKDDDKIIGLCALKKRKSATNIYGAKFEFNATKLVYEPKMRSKMFLY